MAKIWVKGYTKPDGTKVKGHYRKVEKPFKAEITDPVTKKSTTYSFRNKKALEKELDWFYSARKKAASYRIV